MSFKQKLDRILSRVEMSPDYPLGKDLTVGFDRTECDIEAAKTGRPFECTAYRGQVGGADDPARGVFWTPYPLVAQGYADDGEPTQTSRRRGHVKVARLRFRNPFVTDNTTKALRYLLDNGAVERRLGNKLLEIGAYAEPIGERAIAAGMRRLGHDGVIYNGGLDEILDLR